MSPIQKKKISKKPILNGLLKIKAKKPNTAKTRTLADVIGSNRNSKSPIGTKMNDILKAYDQEKVQHTFRIPRYLHKKIFIESISEMNMSMNSALISILNKYFENRKVQMDKKMRQQVGKPIKKAETLLKKAEKSNCKLANYDEKYRDPIIDKAKKAGITRKSK